MTTCKTSAISHRLDEALAQGFPASDPAVLTEPAGDVRDTVGCCCSGDTPAAEAPSPSAAAKNGCGCRG